VSAEGEAAVCYSERVRFGAHVSIRGGVELAADRAAHIGCETLQIFVNSPRQWRIIPIASVSLNRLRRALSARGIEPLIGHTNYLTNLASPDAEMRRKSVHGLAHALRVIEDAGGSGVVTHIGSRAGQPTPAAIRRVAASVRAALRASGRVAVYLEGSAGTTLGATFAELREILDALHGDARVGFCLDTAHLFAAGHDLSRPDGSARAVDEFGAEVGLDRLGLFHLNDAKAPLGSRRDRHENIGEGHIGRAGFRALVRDPRLADVPGILETPGFDDQGPDRRNLDILKSLRAARSRRAPAVAERRTRAT
jgi:deoxyribonuclease-4